MDNDNTPASYSDTIEQIDYRDDEGVPHCHLQEVATNGTDYLLDRDWATMTQAERDEHDEWVGELHVAYVELARAEPDVRQLAQTVLDRCEVDLDSHAVRLAMLGGTWRRTTPAGKRRTPIMQDGAVIGYRDEV